MDVQNLTWMHRIYRIYFVTIINPAASGDRFIFIKLWSRVCEIHAIGYVVVYAPTENL